MGAYNQMYVFRLQVDGLITGGASKRQFTVYCTCVQQNSTHLARMLSCKFGVLIDKFTCFQFILTRLVKDMIFNFCLTPAKRLTRGNLSTRTCFPVHSPVKNLSSYSYSRKVLLLHWAIFLSTCLTILTCCDKACSKKV